MTVQEILLPLFVEVILTFLLLFALLPLRAGDYKSGIATDDNIALREPNWSKRSQQVAYSFSNQFELPVLFYVLTILAYITHLAGLVIRHSRLDIRHLPYSSGRGACHHQ